jgi:hypothetical protein
MVKNHPEIDLVHMNNEAPCHKQKGIGFQKKLSKIPLKRRIIKLLENKSE